MISQNDTSFKLTGQTLGHYELTWNGEKYLVYGSNYAAATVQASRLIRGLKDAERATAWHPCETCGKAIDDGALCPNCDTIDVDSFVCALPETSYQSASAASAEYGLTSYDY